MKNIGAARRRAVPMPQIRKTPPEIKIESEKMIEEPLIETINAALKQPNGKFDINAFGDLLYNGRPLPRGLVECLEVNGIESTLKHLAEAHLRAADIARKRLAEMQCASDEGLKMLDEILARPDRG